MIIRPVGAELFHADGQTDNNEASSRFTQIYVTPGKRPAGTPQQGRFTDSLNALTRGHKVFLGKLIVADLFKFLHSCPA
jgi:hypothetical protein